MISSGTTKPSFCHFFLQNQHRHDEKQVQCIPDQKGEQSNRLLKCSEFIRAAKFEVCLFSRFSNAMLIRIVQASQPNDDVTKISRNYFETHCVMGRQFIPLSSSTVKPRYHKGPKEQKNVFTITRFRYIKVQFHIFYYYWGEEYRSRYQGLRQSRFIEVPRQ